MPYAQQTVRQVLHQKYYSPCLVLSYNHDAPTTKKGKHQILGPAIKFTGTPGMSSRRKRERPHGSAPAPLGVSSWQKTDLVLETRFFRVLIYFIWLYSG